MKSLILKDLYNMGHNAKSMLFMLVIFAVCLLPSTGVEGYIVGSGVLCSMMVVTTLAFDDHCKWTRYALVMPISRKDIVVAKFIVLVIFCGIGSMLGLVFGSICGLLLKKITLSLMQISELLLVALASWMIAIIFGSMSIPLVLKYGSERGRMLLIVSMLIPAGIGFGIYKLLSVMGVAMTDQLIVIILCCSPIIACLWSYVMYRIGYHIFAKQEL